MTPPLFDLTGRVAVVIGGVTGLGHAIALGLADAGAEVVPSLRRLPEVEKAAAEIEALDRRSLRAASDVGDRASLQALHDAILAAFGRVDILVNAAEITEKRPAVEISEADWSSILDTNLTGTLLASRSFLRRRSAL